MTDDDNKKLIMKQSGLITLQEENLQTMGDMQVQYRKALRSRDETIQALRIKIRLQDERIEKLQTNVKFRVKHINHLNTTIATIQERACHTSDDNTPMTT